MTATMRDTAGSGCTGAPAGRDGRRRAILALAALGIAAVVFAASVPATGAPRVRFETKVRISDNPPAFHGKLVSAYKLCERRKVKLMKKRDGRRHRTLGRKRTNGKGEWKVAVGSLSLKPGTYYAKVGRKKVGRAQICQPGRSRRIVVR